METKKMNSLYLPNMISKINNFNVKVDYNTIIKIYKYC